ncbi:MAG: DoxX family membrane protein [Patescibacteria group bacterium]
MEKENSNQSFTTGFHFLRVGLAVTFLWIGILIFKNPEAWGGYLQPWAAGLLPIPLAQAMIGTAILDIIIGIFLLINFLPWLAALLGAVHLIVVLTVSGITDITVRDIGLLVGALALMIDSWPQSIINRINFLKKLTPGIGQSPETK